MYVELIEKDIRNRNNIVEFGSVPTAPADYCRYISLFPFDNGIVDYVKTNKSVSNYKGLHFCPAVVIDIDSDNLVNSQQSAIELCRRLNEVYLVRHDHIRIYFSGNKGFHVSLHGRLFGNIPPHNEIAQYIKGFVLALTDGIPNVDPKIYEPLRVFRCVNSRHDKTGLYKVQISFDELCGSIEDIKAIAATPRTDFKTTAITSELQKNEALYSLLASIRIDKQQEKTLETGFFCPANEGERNNKLFAQACMLFDKSELHTNSIIEVIKSINLAGNKPLSDYEVVNIVQSAQTKTRRTVKTDDLIVKSFGEWADEWYESILPEKNKITLCFDSFDKEMRGKLRGKLIGIVGFAGTKKSLLAQNISVANNQRGNMRTLYSTMEMGVSELMSRYIDLALDGTDTNFSYELEKINYASPGVARDAVVKDIAPFYGDNLLITQNTGLTCKEYDTMISRINSETGRVDILIVDGLSMMGGNGTETELVNKHTKELKELAIKHNLLAIAIIHVTKEADALTRDYTKFLRGSGKIYDNLDISINMSLFKDSFGDEYMKDKGCAMLINKRGSGNHVEVCYDFSRSQLKMTQSIDDPKNYK